MLDKNEIYYSMGGLPQYFNSICEMFKYKITNDTKNIILNTSSANVLKKVKYMCIILCNN